MARMGGTVFTPSGAEKGFPAYPSHIPYSSSLLLYSIHPTRLLLLPTAIHPTNLLLLPILLYIPPTYCTPPHFSLPHIPPTYSSSSPLLIATHPTHLLLLPTTHCHTSHPPTPPPPHCYTSHNPHLLLLPSAICPITPTYSSYSLPHTPPT